ncbi:MAG TPA: hypothetical protein PKI03_35575 [Pseudomonadota bacterium]|nr:hypothetical protein [Pseudomonadota bacterium]
MPSIAQRTARIDTCPSTADTLEFMTEIIRLPGLITYLQAQHKQVETFPEDRLRFTYCQDGREVPVGGYVLRAASGNQWLTLTMKVCPMGRLRARSALVANGELPVGGLTVLLGEVVALRQTLPLEALLPAQLEEALRAMLVMTDQLKHVAELDDADLETPFAYIFR